MYKYKNKNGKVVEIESNKVEVRYVYPIEYIKLSLIKSRSFINLSSLVNMIDNDDYELKKNDDEFVFSFIDGIVMKVKSSNIEVEIPENHYLVCSLNYFGKTMSAGLYKINVSIKPVIRRGKLI